MLGHAANFKDLIVYQKSKVLAKEVFILSQRFPRDETYSLTDQVRRSPRSIGAQIAEAWAKRLYEKHFVSKLTDADGEQYETQHWVDIALDCGYLTDEEANRLNASLTEIGRMLNGMMSNSASFCGGTPSMVREESDDYFVS